MNRLISLIVLGCVSVSSLNAQNEVSIEEFDKKIESKKTKAEHLDELVITISIKTKDTLAEGDRALKSLYSNLDFINKVATSQEFRDCVVAKEYKKDLLAKKASAKRLLEKRGITHEQYQEYIENQNSALNSLNNKISTLCKEGE